MKKKNAFAALLIAAITLSCAVISCTFEPEVSSIGDTTINRGKEDRTGEIPFESAEVLSRFSADPKIIGYERARVLALLELMAKGIDVDMGWEGHRLEPLPVVIYGLDNRPRYYDFIVLDAEAQPIGTIRSHARRVASTTISSYFHGIADYKVALSKAGFDGALFEDWRGSSFVGLRGRAGELPGLLINPETGETVEAEKDLEGVEIIEAFMDSDFPALASQGPTMEGLGISEDDPDYEEVLKAISAIESKTPEEIEASLQAALQQETEQSEAFWAAVEEKWSEIEPLLADEDELFDVQGKFLGRLFKKIVNVVVTIFTGVDETKYWLNRYTNSPSMYREFYYKKDDTWCGPWATGYIMWVKEGRRIDRYDRFLSYATTTGGFFIGAALWRATNDSRPMFPSEMQRAFLSISGGRIRIGDSWIFDSWHAYDHIKRGRGPALLLCSVKGEPHWQVAVGARQDGSRFWRTYHFLLQDN
ncbi:MAG: hypothetical protein FWD91_04515, partial [Treponema sp.]|nr:hypothetical protein [Treponema sp.]